jgi:hypothetical protein
MTINTQESINKAISIVRSPEGYTATEFREAQLYCASLVEIFQEAYSNMREFAEANGLDTAARG